jgi:hypothetical protein
MISWLRSAWRWLTERAPQEPQHLRADDLVELIRLSNRFEADAVAARLRSAGLRSVVFYADANGWHPELGLVQGNRVMVRAEDAAEARHITGPS